MRKLILSALLVAATSSLFAQKLEDIQKDVEKKKYTEAKAKVDAALNDAKNQSNADFWFAKAQVYNTLAKEQKDLALQNEALTAIQKYFELESSKEESKRAIKSMMEGHKTAFDIYSGFFQTGVTDFQAEKWQQAYNNFSKTLTAFDLLSKNKITTVSFDTTAVLYAGYSAQNAKLTDKAAEHYAQLAEIKIADTNYVSIYEYLVGYYQEKKDQATAQKYIDLGKTLFPNNPNWVAYELQGVDGDKSKKIAKLEQLIQQNPKNAELVLEYAVDLYNYNYSGDKPADYEKRQEDLTKALNNSIELNPTDPYHYYIYTLHIDKQIEGLKQKRGAIKGTKPEDTKQRQEISKTINAKVEEQAKHAQTAFDIYDKKGANLKGNEKSNFKVVANMLYDYYYNKKDDAKAKYYDDKIMSIK